MTANLNNLSDEITVSILSFLDPKDLSRVACVDTQLHRIADDNALWILFLKEAKCLVGHVDSAKDIFLNVQRIHEFKELRSTFQHFIEKLDLNTVATFDCASPDLGEVIHVRWTPPGNPVNHIAEKYIFTGLLTNISTSSDQMNFTTSSGQVIQVDLRLKVPSIANPLLAGKVYAKAQKF